jgi:probable F420-dependent oxidoreductase
VFPGDGLIGPADLGRAVEDRGFDALFFPEHLHMPVHRSAAFPTGIPLPDIYRRNLDPLVAFGAVAAVTSRLTLGTAVTLVAQRDPILLAKSLASLDQMSGGRLLVGVGAGWNVEEMRNHGVDPDRRWGRVREHVEAMRAIWSAEVASYAGRSVAFDEIWSWPKPWRRSRIPVLIGGRNLERVVRWGDGWLPVVADDIDGLLADVAKLRRREREERPGDHLDITVVCDYGRRLAPAEFTRLSGSEVDRILCWIPSAPYDETVAALDDVRSVALSGGWRADDRPR